MNTFWLHIRAPFAAFRGFQAGVYRSTSPVMPPSTAYGLVLNIAGIEMRAASNGATTLIRSDIPRLRLAIGLIKVAARNFVYQQLHGYRVGTDKKTKAMAALTKGGKYQIVPVRREMLVDYEGVKDEQYPRKLKTSILEILQRPELLRRGASNVSLAREHFDYGVLAQRMTKVIDATQSE